MSFILFIWGRSMENPVAGAQFFTVLPCRGCMKRSPGMCHQACCKDCSVGRWRSLYAVDMSWRKIKVNITQSLLESVFYLSCVFHVYVGNSYAVHHSLPKQAVISLFPTEVQLMFLCLGNGQNLSCFPLFTISDHLSLLQLESHAECPLREQQELWHRVGLNSW